MQKNTPNGEKNLHSRNPNGGFNPDKKGEQTPQNDGS